MNRLGQFLVVSFVLTLTFFEQVRAEEVKIVRDDFGIPHIFADTDEGAAYAFGYAQAEDRLEQLLKNYRTAEGTLSEAFGPDHYYHDYRQRVWKHREVSKEKYKTIGAKSRGIIEAFQKGIQKYMDENPDEVPDWAPELEPWQVVALARLIIWGWPEGDAGGDLRAAGIRPDPIEYRGSNEWLIAPDRTAEGVPIALIDPHLGWYGIFRFYEGRFYGEELNLSGVCILGSPLISLGHNEYLSVAMTTGSGDTADVFVEKVNPDNPLQYEVDGEWRDMTVRKEIIRVKKEDGTYDEKEEEIHYTHHGPVVKRQDGKAYTMAIPYLDDVSLTDQTFEMMTAKNLSEAKAALSHLGLMGQNVMVGTVDGDIYYQRTGKVPIRAEGTDPSKPIPGHLSKNDWQGIHPMEDLVSCENPPHGYMQNCNVSPFGMMKDSPMRLKDYPDYVYGTTEWPPHQRAAMVVDILHNDPLFTIEEALDLAVNVEVYNAGKWQDRLEEAVEGQELEKDISEVYELLRVWDRHSRPDSAGAMAFKYWKDALPEEVRKGDRMGDPPPDSLTDEMAIEGLNEAAKNLKDYFGSLTVTYGEVYRVGRKGGKETWPVGGGNPGSGMATPRAIGFDDIEGHRYLGRGGQTSTQVVLLTKPPQSWTLLPLGQSDDQDSPHWDDQAEKLFSRGLLKPTYFMDPEGLEEVKVSEKVLDY